MLLLNHWQLHFDGSRASKLLNVALASTFGPSNICMGPLDYSSLTATPPTSETSLELLGVALVAVIGNQLSPFNGVF